MNGNVNIGPECDVISTSRVRLARNFNEYPFPSKMDNKQAEEIINKVKDAIFNCEDEEIGNLLFVNMENLGDVDKQMLVEKHLISPELAASKRKCATIISRNENISIMINEEDHLRIQVLFPGMQIDKAQRLCGKIDDILDSKIEFAFSNTYGYLTCCPTNVGTGIRVSLCSITCISYDRIYKEYTRSMQ